MQLKCRNRKIWVAATPEEMVRQTWLTHLEAQGFPLALISVEKLVQGQHQSFPLRRSDILCFRKGSEGLHPLLLIECKATHLTKKALHQAIGYNYTLKAPFLALANQNEIQFGWFSQEGWRFINYLPTYSELLSQSVVKK